MKTGPSFKGIFDEARQHDDYWTEGLILEFTEELSRWMTERKISRSALAAKIGHSPAYVTKVLRGDANFTAATMTKLARAVGAEVRVHLAPTGSRTAWYDQHAAETEVEEVSGSCTTAEMLRKKA
ncbi:MAG TPA: helix-turn-helix transcriptional regulator [Thermoanaerobaculia bacterium]|jgi:transcriptional regulator with XRE-family HTH domain|nr:helix-turn-helix transcriptional regulator [Thermoanaerobaculia bacterium]